MTAVAITILRHNVQLVNNKQGDTVLFKRTDWIGNSGSAMKTHDSITEQWAKL